ncbi:D-isomer specific 2-hydroxyacid dehydrogenase, NAD binding domain [Pseudomonas sp. NFACC48-1]|nr:D-isomer specific 2-hydroxyacid dehydrogenase, NAD binding domain [Pseudomonas sp. NFACC44-2]SDA91628.1 D-isomer specific 2-hydroxyacid dehydrogenase, NAD binding domain [Pseudomonas sp. NFACC51]SDW45049.1 D-isomer specific 2-hydroxyacid dehydrogenase, NAD binding domain [Pseudomonas sp. NFACC08-1]SFJ27014.1 D-isomer specific 2-hydroxyacid dehydrogenase, NAD binding domain [Pseudomonas sp. NFACC54]SFT30647.1 D-isomer specific 2-hydroxyacid dehydrogenase, NAD binding domain [Pseudomonas sp. N
MLLTSDFVKSRYEELRARAPMLQIITELGTEPDPDVTALFSFKLPSGIAPRLPNLRLAASVGAGADGILAAQDLPENVRVTRVMDPGLGLSMAQYVALQILARFRSLSKLQTQHLAGEWRRIPVPDASKVTVGIMGLGSIGAVVARVVGELGFRVIGWTRSDTRAVNVPVFTGKRNIQPFLEQCDYLVCLLPFTTETAGLIDHSLLSKLPKESYVINVARGGIVVESDLLKLIDDGHLSGAALDVFETEPLHPTSAFWRREEVLVTPHIAAQPSVMSAVEQFIDNLRRLTTGEPLTGEIDRSQGY